MIKIAYLIEAHTDINRLIDLCEALILSGDVFIHIDKKNKDHVFWQKLLDYQKSKKQITILGKQERHYVAWAGFSQVECFKSLLRKVLDNPKQYDRFILLSGLDYPVWSPIQIQNYFENNIEKEFICGYDISTCKYDYQLRKIIHYHFFRDIPLPHKSMIRRIIIGGTMTILKCIGIKRKPFLKINNQDWHIYFGSSWISCTRACGEYIFQQLNNKEITRYFKTVYAPDELCVPTIVMNSPFKKNAIKVNDLTFQNITPLHYLNYEDCIWSYDENDFNTIIRANKMFVRKVISGKSEKLIQMIQRTWNLQTNIHNHS